MNKGKAEKAGKRFNKFHLALQLRAIGLLIEEGMPLKEAVGIVISSGIEGEALKALARCQAGLTKGDSLAVSLHEAGFPPLIVQTVAAGEEKGKLGYALKLLSDELERQIICKPGKDLGGQATIMTHVLTITQAMGIPLIHGVGIAAGMLEHTGLRNALLKVEDDLSNGVSFADALEKHPNVMGKFYVNCVRAGEKSGHLDITLGRLALFLDRMLKMQEKSAK